MRLVSQQCTQVPQNGAERPFSLICVHSYVLTSVHNGATVYTNDPKLCREAILANLCTLLRSHGRSRDRVGLGAPRHRRPHDPRDARALGPEAHAAGAVTQPLTYTNSRSLLVRSSQLQSHSELQKSDLAAHPARFNRLEQIRAEQAYKRSRKKPQESWT